MKRLAILLLLSSSFAFPSLTQAQELNYQCVGIGLADYMNEVVKGASGLSNIRLLTPAFNMTSFTFQDIVGAMDSNNADWVGIYGVAGNIYNVDGRGLTSWLDEKKAQLPNGLKSKPIILTETGDKDVADEKISPQIGWPNLGRELNSALNNKGVEAALLFNAFNTNDDFSGFSFPTDEDIRRDVCGLSCGRIGVNYAVPFSTNPNFYSRATGLGMNYQLAIATIGSIENIKAALSSGTNLVIRIGNMDSSGGFDKPSDYVGFLKQVNAEAVKKGVVIYAIAGPNEPDREFWAAPQCKTSQLPAKKGPLEEGFNPQNSSLKKCDQTTDSEYHPLRPYPGNPCDPLIPKSIPEAPVTSEKKFNTFACGTSLTPSTIERFDAYGQNGYYESLDFGYGSAHTICDPVPEDSPNGTTVNCWRSEVFDITLDLSKANLGILGNTQDVTLTDEQKVNEYLSWYLTGTPQIGDQIPLSSKNPADIDRLINFSGPLRKLLPADLQNIGRTTVAGSAEKDVHNYLAGDNLFGLDKVRIDRFSGWLGGINEVLLQKIFQNVPFSSLEDTAGEVTVSVFRDPAAQQQTQNISDPVSRGGKSTAPLKLIIKKAELAK